jgi:hypothetical protein
MAVCLEGQFTVLVRFLTLSRGIPKTSRWAVFWQLSLSAKPLAHVARQA